MDRKPANQIDLAVQAIERWNLDEMDRLISLGLDVNSTFGDDGYYTIFGYAAGRAAIDPAGNGAHLEMLRKMLVAGGNPNVRSMTGQTPFIFASVCLVDGIGSVCSTTSLDNIPARQRESFRAVAKILLDAGADPYARNQYGRTAENFVLAAKDAIREYMEKKEKQTRGDGEFQRPDFKKKSAEPDKKKDKLPR